MGEDNGFVMKVSLDASGVRRDIERIRKELLGKPVEIPVRAQVVGAFAGALNSARGVSGTATERNAAAKFATGLRTATSELGRFGSALRATAARLASLSVPGVPSVASPSGTAPAAPGFPSRTATALMALPGISMLGGMAMRGIGSVKNFGMGSVDLYNAQRRAEIQFAQVLGNAGMGRSAFEDVKAHAGDIQRRTMFGDEAMIAGAGELATYVKDPESLKRMMDILADYAAGMTGGSEVGVQRMVDLATGLGKAFDGTYDSFREKGFDTSGLERISRIEADMEEARSGNPVSAKRAAEIAESAKAFNELGGDLEKAKIDAIAEALSDWKGLAESFAGTSQGSMTQLKNDIGDIREEVGRELLPVLGEVAKSMRESLPEIRGLFKNLGDTFSNVSRTVATFLPALAKAASVVTGFLGTVSAYLPALVAFGGVFKGLPMAASGLQALAVAVKALVVGNPLGLAASAVVGFAVAAVKLTEKLQERRKDERRAAGDSAVAEIERMRNGKWKDPDYARRVIEGETGEWTDESVDDDGNKYGKGLKGKLKMAAIQYAKANGDAIPASWKRTLESMGIGDIRYRTGNRTHHVRAEAADGDGPDVRDLERIQKEVMDAAKHNVTNYTYAPNIRQTNNISTQFDELGKLVKENIRELATSRLTFRTSAEAAKAVAL